MHLVIVPVSRRRHANMSQYLSPPNALSSSISMRCLSIVRQSPLPHLHIAAVPVKAPSTCHYPADRQCHDQDSADDNSHPFKVSDLYRIFGRRVLDVEYRSVYVGVWETGDRIPRVLLARKTRLGNWDSDCRPHGLVRQSCKKSVFADWSSGFSDLRRHA